MVSSWHTMFPLFFCPMPTPSSCYAFFSYLLFSIQTFTSKLKMTLSNTSSILLIFFLIASSHFVTLEAIKKVSGIWPMFIPVRAHLSKMCCYPPAVPSVIHRCTSPLLTTVFLTLAFVSCMSPSNISFSERSSLTK